MKDNYKIVCSWCGAIIQDGPQPDDEISHGICPDCFFIQSQILRFRKHVGFEELAGLSDQAIWKVYKNSYLMGRIRLAIRFEQFQKACIDSIKDIGTNLNNIRKLFNAKSP